MKVDNKNGIGNPYHKDTTGEFSTAEEASLSDATSNDILSGKSIGDKTFDIKKSNKYDYLYIVGGGAQNKFLNKCIMEFIKNKEIIILPIEATSIGNLHVQMESDNEKRS